jgi:hypothetical protein
MRKSMNRREFLQASANGALVAVTSTEAWAQPEPPEQPGWYDRPMRWAQLAFVEDDPGNYDPKFWLTTSAGFTPMELA